jgi:NitT/TauT family transport system ATP-binding protein
VTAQTEPAVVDRGDVHGIDDLASSDDLGLDDVRFSYPNGVEALGGVSATIERGTTVGIVGPSGCGKSTLLYLIAGLYAPSGGSVRRPDAGPDVHPLSMVFQKDTLLPWLTTEENVSYFLRFKHSRAIQRRRGGDTDAEMKERVAELLRLGHLSDRATTYPYRLSGGMRRRLQFLAGVAMYPQVLLLDEPFSSVDEPTRIGIHQDVYRITRTLGTTTVLVTHDLAEAISLCDRVLILSSRPAVVAAEHVISFDGERDMLHLRRTPEFLNYYGDLWDGLSAQISKSRVTGSAQ